MKLFGWNITPDVKDEVGRRRKSARQYHNLSQKYETSHDMRMRRLAIDTSNNTENYSRYDLHDIYRQAIIDPTVASQWDTRVLKTLDKEFHVDLYGEINEKAMKIFKAPWFHQWVRAVLDQHMWGYSLIEFGLWDDEKTGFKPYMDSTGLYHTAIEVVDRDYVKPEFGTIVPDYGDGKGAGVSYLTTKASERLMFVGSANKTSTILYKISGYFLLKDNAHKNWSEWAEVFAMDMRLGKTMASGAERKAFIDMLRDMGSNGYGVIDDEDSVEYIGVNRQDAYQVYLAFLDYCDAKISEVIFGQSVVTNNTGRVVGKVGEEISNLYGDSDAKLVEWYINTELIPYMISLGAELEGAEFIYDTTEKVKLSERAKIDKSIADSGYQINKEYLERTYGVELEEYIGVPYSGREGEEE